MYTVNTVTPHLICAGAADARADCIKIRPIRPIRDTVAAAEQLQHNT